MKRALIVLIVAAMFVVGSPLLSGCNSESTDPATDIIGTWKQTTDLNTISFVSDPETKEYYMITFNKDGTASPSFCEIGSSVGTELTSYFNYTVSDGVIEVVFVNSATPVTSTESSIPFTGSVSIKGDTLSIELVDGTIIAFKKV